MKLALALALVATAYATTRIVFQVPPQTRENAIATSSIIWDGSVLNIPQHTEKLQSAKSVAEQALAKANDAYELAQQAIDEIADFKATPGPKGERGTDGNHGNDGDDGAKGERGTDGNHGNDGAKGERGDTTGASDALNKANAAYELAEKTKKDIHETPLAHHAFDASKCVDGGINILTRECICNPGFTGGGPYEEGSDYPACNADPCVNADSGIEGNFLKCAHGTIAGTTGDCRCECGTTGFTGLKCDVCAPGSGREGDNCVACERPDYNNQDSHEAECSPQTCPEGEGVTSDDEGWNNQGGNCVSCGKDYESLSYDDGQCVAKDCQNTDPDGGAYKECRNGGTVSGKFGNCECSCDGTGYSGSKCQNALPCQSSDSSALAGYKTCTSSQTLTGKTGNCKCEANNDYSQYRCFAKRSVNVGACGSSSSAYNWPAKCKGYVDDYPNECQYCIWGVNCVWGASWPSDAEY